jgi:ABC-2 type transport system ATP-binding protein
MTDRPAIAVEGLTHRYGARAIYERLSFTVPPGRILGLLGKNGVGKTTLIKILMGFLAPTAGRCRVLGEPSHALSADAKRRIGLVFEGHLAYDFMSIRDVERFFSAWYPRWRRDVFHDLIDRLGLPLAHRIRTMSEGQRSQVVLGVVMAQDPDLLILDDYTMGLDAGYRRLFLDYLIHYAREGRKTVLVTSHVVQDMERLVDDVIFLRRGGHVLHTSLPDFMGTFRQYRLPRAVALATLPDAGDSLHSVEREADGAVSVFAFRDRPAVEATLRAQGIDPAGLIEQPMTLEDAFVGYTGKY